MTKAGFVSFPLTTLPTDDHANMGWQYVPLLLVAPLVDAAVTVHHPPEDLFTMTQSSIAPGETFSGNRAYDPTELEPPENGGYVPNFDINLQPAGTQDGLSHQLPSPFFGFSIEMSVSNQVCEYLAMLRQPFVH